MNHSVPVGDAMDAQGVLLKHFERLHKLLFQGVEAVKNTLVGAFKPNR